jgi:hypothetical protein
VAVQHVTHFLKKKKYWQKVEIACSIEASIMAVVDNGNKHAERNESERGGGRR